MLKHLPALSTVTILLSNIGAAQIPVSQHVIADNQAVHQQLNFTDRADFEAAQRGFIASDNNTATINDQGVVVFDYGQQRFLEQTAPMTVNPSLWRQSQLTSMHGLFEVTEGIYQVRGFDLSNITFIQGETGWLVVDPLISKEVAAKAKALVDRELGEKPIRAVIFTHSHIDHYGGVRGLVSEAEVDQGVEIVAPADFVLETVSENVLAGNAMSRRATYMFGSLIGQGSKANVGVGLGQNISTGTYGMLAPTTAINKTGERLNIDGVELQFIMARGAEAPSEFMFYLPQFKAFCQAEIINHTLHNLLTPRGAKVRDGRLWSKYIDQAIMLYGDRAEVSFGSHHWPTWGKQRLNRLWADQRDLYRFIHDQTLRLANEGATLNEIPSKLILPEALAKQFANRGYYGALGFNARSQYQLYYGFFDGNPANLNPLPPVAEAKKYVEYMGGADAVLKRAKQDYENGEFRFLVTALNHLVFADPANDAAKKMLADAYTQLAYTAESGVHRNFYLTAAMELMHGVPDVDRPTAVSADIVKAIPLHLYFDLLAVRLNGTEAAEKKWQINFEIRDTGETALLFLSNGTLHHRLGQTSEDADATLNLTRDALDQLNLKTASLLGLIARGEASISGNPITLTRFFNLIEEPMFWFNIVTP